MPVLVCYIDTDGALILVVDGLGKAVRNLLVSFCTWHGDGYLRAYGDIVVLGLAGCGLLLGSSGSFRHLCIRLRLKGHTKITGHILP